ncbi:MAG TPA: tetratricopeptide repeat protein [Pyrinomonadaceae bacterium]|nr:tetratricopeptide repeat protein [Pyrinomonadaceae bacterium]
MSNVRGKIFCQRCKSPNELGEDSCGQCGTRLMLLVEPSGARFESRGTGGVMEEHLLERVTAIETHISRVIDKLEKMAELMLKQSRSAFFDHELLDTLITVLGESGAISRQRLAELWRERRKKEATDEAGEAEGRSRFEGMIGVVLEHYAGDEREQFEGLVREAFGEIEKGSVTAGLRRLERAAALARENGPLNHFLGVQLYRRGRTAPARDYFERALAVDKENGWLHLLLGLACGDEGEAERARQLLKDSVILGGPTFAAHYALGRLSAAESNWKVALSEFKLARATRPGPEAHYLLGLANFHLGRDRTALRELKKATGLDAGYAEAHYLLGLVLLRLGEGEEARKAFEAAAGARPGVRRYVEAGKDPDAAAPPALFETKGRGRRRRLITGGDERLAAALREDALGKAAGA